MPYRRLPKTDLSRIKALQKAVNMEGYKENGELVLSYQTIRDAQQLLSKFRSAQRKYDQYYGQFLKTDKSYKDEAKVAKMYISHFIQVLNMTIMRGELKSEIKPSYGLEIDDNTCPKMKSEAEIIEWGKKIIAGEELRVSRGGVPLYNPNIAKVKVYYSIFAEHYYSINGLKQNAEKYREELVQMRPEVDDLLLDLWNQVENFYSELPLSKSLEKCGQFGLIYYLRTSEKKQIEAEQMQGLLDF